MSDPAIAEDAVEIATAAQRAASDPQASAFVSASAGSGKTKLLIDRLLRLMLPSDGRAGTPPERILCLTFTKAGAANMAIRLRQTLARWVVADDAELERDLAALSLPADAAGRDAARALFARILDLPGGLRIETIHAFCESLLRRFPLEARVAPQFRLVEDVEAGASLERAREGAIAVGRASEAVARLASRIETREHADLTSTLLRETRRLAHAVTLEPEALADELGRALRLARRDLEALALAEREDADRVALEAAFGLLAGEGSKGEAAAGARGLELLRAAPFEPAAWRELLLTAAGAPRKLPTAASALGRRDASIGAAIAAEAGRLVEIEDARRAIRLVEATVDLLSLAAPALAAYRAGKDASGLLDFDDLIERTEALLSDPGTAFVLFKLDGGLDHLLLDEVQDTSATQWEIAGALTEEFFAGSGANPNPRTVFAVGDVKQSIFSFQGASPSSFATWRTRFRDRVEGAGGAFREPGLHVSFRSAPAILAFVDVLFADPIARRGVVEPGADRVPGHRSARPELRGRVEVWPLAPMPADAVEAAGPWAAPMRNRGGRDAVEELADAVARRVAKEVADGMAPGDILILSRRRRPFARAMIRSLKALDVPVAGIDRMVPTEQLAVQDLLALCEALLLPEDSFSLACFLKSPLGGLDDDQLMELALGRAGSLAASLGARRDEPTAFGRAARLFETLLARVDYRSPHALLSEALGEWGGRARILARLGPEAGEAIDEMLSLALQFGRERIPSMQGFTFWLRRHTAEIRREAAEAGGESGHASEVRLMTVHGAKGLEARLVVLADTVSVPDTARERLFWTGEAPVLPVWLPGKDLASPATEALQAARLAELEEEYNRLLYVATTRAKETLIVCGWSGRREVQPQCWHARAADAMGRLDGVGEVARVLPWDGAILAFGTAATGAGRAESARPAARGAPPHWAGRAETGWVASPPPPEPVPRRSLAPSRPEGVAFGPAPGGTSPLAASGREAARRRGEVLHALLQHVPTLAEGAREAAARAFAGARLDADDAEGVVGEVLAVLGHPALAEVFGPAGRAEQRVAGVVGGIAVTGVVDRMAILPGAIVLVDFKSGRTAPAEAARTPVAYLRQMAAYRAVLRQVVPGRPCRCALVWTADATVSVLDETLLDAHAPGGGLA